MSAVHLLLLGCLWLQDRPAPVVSAHPPRQLCTQCSGSDCSRNGSWHWLNELGCGSEQVDLQGSSRGTDLCCVPACSLDTPEERNLTGIKSCLHAARCAAAWARIPCEVACTQRPVPAAQHLLKLVGLEEAERGAAVLTWESRTEASKMC